MCLLKPQNVTPHRFWEASHGITTLQQVSRKQGDEMHTSFSPLTLLAICMPLSYSPVSPTLRWSHGHGFLRFLAICAGIALLVISNSRDRRAAESTQSALRVTGNKSAMLKNTENQQLSRIEKLASANKDLASLLSKSSAEKQEAAEEARRLRGCADGRGSDRRSCHCPTRPTTRRLYGSKSGLFDVDKSALACGSKEILSKVIGFLIYHVRVPHTQIQVFGHTDITGSDAHDDALSDARAAK